MLEKKLSQPTILIEFVTANVFPILHSYPVY